jgi:hypothetical protein
MIGMQFNESSNKQLDTTTTNSVGEAFQWLAQV